MSMKSATYGIVGLGRAPTVVDRPSATDAAIPLVRGLLIEPGPALGACDAALGLGVAVEGGVPAAGRAEPLMGGTPPERPAAPLARTLHGRMLPRARARRQGSPPHGRHPRRVGAHLHSRRSTPAQADAEADGATTRTLADLVEPLRTRPAEDRARGCHGRALSPLPRRHRALGARTQRPGPARPFFMRPTDARPAARFGAVDVHDHPDERNRCAPRRIGLYVGRPAPNDCHDCGSDNVLLTRHHAHAKP